MLYFPPSCKGPAQSGQEKLPGFKAYLKSKLINCHIQFNNFYPIGQVQPCRNPSPTVAMSALSSSPLLGRTAASCPLCGKRGESVQVKLATSRAAEPKSLGPTPKELQVGPTRFIRTLRSLEECCCS